MAMDMLYSFRRCPYAIRARLALRIAQVPVEIFEVDLRNKPTTMIMSSPKGTVPVLVLATGQVIDESLAIMRWALHRHDPEAWLGGDDVTLIEDFDGRFKAHLDRYKYATLETAERIESRSMCTIMLDDLEARLMAYGNLCRASRSLTDFALLPFIRQFASVDRPWFDSLPLPHVRDWLEGHIMSPLFVQVMMKERAAPC